MVELQPDFHVKDGTKTSSGCTRHGLEVRVGGEPGQNEAIVVIRVVG